MSTLEAFKQLLATMPVEQILCHEARLWDERVLNFEMLKACDEIRQHKEKYSMKDVRELAKELESD